VGLLLRIAAPSTDTFEQLRRAYTWSFPRPHAPLYLALEDRRRVPASVMDHLYRRADAYVSLHHAEGFGITLAEAMRAGLPVVATGATGNMDFMHDDTAFLVSSKLTKVGAAMHGYPDWEPEMVWHEPELESAVEAMRACVQKPTEAKRRALRGQAAVSAMLSYEAVGKQMAARLSALA
jgi:glycosyltransferase involved in cell wall biosynthesis